MPAVVNITIASFFVLALNYNGIYSYSIPQPKIEVFRPRGLRVSIEDSPGVHLFGFHGSVNRQLIDLEGGRYSKEVRHPRNGRWVIEDKSAEFHIGDKIFYWLFVSKDNLGYRLSGQCFIVEELLLSPDEKPVFLHPSYITEPPYIFEAITETQKHELVITSVPHTSIDLSLCQETILNSTQALINLRTELEKTKKLNQQLIMAIQEYPGSKQIKLSGLIPPDGTPLATVQFILREKLDLKPKILWAAREDTYAIIFEVPSVLEKYGILAIANEKLKNSKIKLS